MQKGDILEAPKMLFLWKRSCLSVPGDMGVTAGKSFDRQRIRTGIKIQAKTLHS